MIYKLITLIINSMVFSETINYLKRKMMGGVGVALLKIFFPHAHKYNQNIVTTNIHGDYNATIMKNSEAREITNIMIGNHKEKLEAQS